MDITRTEQQEVAKTTSVPEAVIERGQTDISARFSIRFQEAWSLREAGDVNWLLNAPLACQFSISACCSMVQDQVNYFRQIVTLYAR